MKVKFVWQLILAGALIALSSAQAAEATARIKKVWTEKTNVVVEVETTGSVLKVTLESSARVGIQTWEPRAVRFLTNGEPENVTFTLTAPLAPKMEILRVRSDLTRSSLPAEFFSGQSKFVSGADGGGAAVFDGAGPVNAAPTREAAPGLTTDTRSVVESDIWKLEGDTLFFFNQYRGLQVIDVTTPDQPFVTGTYDVAAAGEQMYVINGTNIVLLARDNCAWYGSSSESRLILLQLRGGAPHVVKEIPVAGQISESRLVGSALYLVANSYQQRTISTDRGPEEQWDWGSHVTSYDLNNFETAARKSSDWVSGYGNVINATDRFLFVAQSTYTENQTRSLIHIYDISAPDGVFTKASTIAAAGYVKDKFKMHMTGNTFVAVVQENSRPLGTYVSTYSLENPQQPQRLAHLKIIDNEQLFATRFHGDLLYVVTFFIIDPLWVVDLSDPTAPKKVGELEIPGWSTYLQPIGDKLLAIGFDGTNGARQTAVQLFDVANPAKPSLLSKVLIGEQWSSSEANWDEKAFGVLPEHNLVLVPFNSSGTNGYFEGVQLIDLNERELVKRGTIAQNMAARRATLHRDRILSLSSRELLTVNASNRDNPVVTKKTELSWAADQVHLVGDYVIEIDAYRSEGPAIHVVDAANTGNIRLSSSLTNLPYLGSTVNGTKLYVLQGRSVEFIYPTTYDPDNWKPLQTNPAVFVLSVFDTTQLPALPLVASTAKVSTSEQYFGGRYKALEPKPGLIVWTTGSGGMPWWGWRGGPMIDVAFGAPVGRGLVADFAPWHGGSGHMIAVDTALSAIVSEVQLTGTNGWWNFSDSYSTGGLVYTSHSVTEYDPTIDPPPYTWEYNDGKRMVTVTNDPPPGVWVQRYFLDVVNFNEPVEPVVRKPISIPGSLIGIDRGGELLYTRAYDLRSEETVAAASYDGIEARLVDSFALGSGWPRPTRVNENAIYAGIPGTNNIGGSIEVWTLATNGKFERFNKIEMKEPVQEFALFGDLLVAQSGVLSLFDATDALRPNLIGSGQANACYGVQLSAADGTIQRGLWVPMGWYGVVHIPLQPATTTTAN